MSQEIDQHIFKKTNSRGCYMTTVARIILALNKGQLYFFTYFDEKCTLWLVYALCSAHEQSAVWMFCIEQILGSQDVVHRFMFCFVLHLIFQDIFVEASIKHYFVEAPGRPPSLPRPKSGAVSYIMSCFYNYSCIYHCLSSSVISESFLAMKNCDDQCYQ